MSLSALGQRKVRILGAKPGLDGHDRGAKVVARALRDEIGHFGTLLMAGHNGDQPKLWRRPMELLATDVMPKFAQQAG